MTDNKFIGLEYSSESKKCVHFVEGDCTISWDKTINDFHSCNRKADYCYICIADFVNDERDK